MSLNNTRMKAMVDTELALSTHHNYVAFSTNGSSENTYCPRLAVTWSTPTEADPYEPSNTALLTLSPTHPSGTLTPTHWATAAAGTNGVADLDTIWIPVTDPDPIITVGSSATIAIGALKPLSADRV